MHEPVFSCVEAASARGIELSQELKSLIFNVNGKYVVVHLRGSQRVDSKKLYKLYKIPFKKRKHIQLISLEVLKSKFDSDYGLVCPFSPKIWRAKHVISEELIETNEIVYTNDGTLTGTVSFRVSLLKKTQFWMVRDIIKS